MKFSCAVMMHPKRERYRDYLLSKLGNASVIMDRGRGIWDTARRAWLSYSKEADYHLVVQDDAIIGKDFYQNLEKEINAHPNRAYCLYFGNRKSLKKEDVKKWINDRGVERDAINWGVAICLPTTVIENCIKEGDRMKEYKNHDDTKLSKYLQMIGMRIRYPIPSLVDHRWREPSMMERNLSNKMRKAFCFIGE